MRDRLTAELVHVGDALGIALAVAADQQDGGEHHGSGRVPGGVGLTWLWEPAPPGRREIGHGRSVGIRRARVALPRLTIRLLPREYAGGCCSRGGTGKCLPSPDDGRGWRARGFLASAETAAGQEIGGRD